MYQRLSKEVEGLKVNNNSDNNKIKQGIFWEARTRILAWYLTLITTFLMLSIPLVTRLILFQVNTRVRNDLTEEINAFNTFQKKHFPNIETSDQKQLMELHQDFLTYKVPEDDTFLITIIEGKFYQSSPSSLPPILGVKSPLMQYWSTIQDAREGESISSEPEIDKILYLAQPIIIQGEVKGIFIAAHITAGEIQEALSIIKIAVGVWLMVLMLTALAAWIASGKVLNPLQKLSQAVSAINESDLEQRITVIGTGEIAQLTQGFNQMMERLQNVFTSQRELLNDAGHELRTPITIIRGHLELMGSDPEEQQETLNIVFDELDRMSRLVNNLILLAKAERFDFLHEETIDIPLFTEEIYSKITTLAQRNWQLNNYSRGFLKGDRQRLTQAILNLAQNAVQHTQDSDIIVFGSSTESNAVYFWIKDTGEGFSPEDKDLIFQRFARAKNNRRSSEGQGLGLSIVQAIAQAHKGNVIAKGELGKGATFTLILPLNNR